MELELTSENNMKLNRFMTKINPWAGLFVSLMIVIPSLYEILGAAFIISANHISLVGGLFFFVFFLRQIFDRIIFLEGTE